MKQFIKNRFDETETQIVLTKCIWRVVQTPIAIRLNSIKVIGSYYWMIRVSAVWHRQFIYNNWHGITMTFSSKIDFSVNWSLYTLRKPVQNLIISYKKKKKKWFLLCKVKRSYYNVTSTISTVIIITFWRWFTRRRE